MPDPHAAAEQQARAAAIAQHAAKSAAASDGAGGGAGDGGAGGAKGGDADARQAAAVKASQERLLRKMHGEHACDFTDDDEEFEAFLEEMRHGVPVITFSRRAGPRKGCMARRARR